MTDTVMLISLCSSKVQCTKPDCRKWRQLTKEIQLTASLAATYRCGMKFNNIKVNSELKKWFVMCVFFLSLFVLMILHVCL